MFAAVVFLVWGVIVMAVVAQRPSIGQSAGSVRRIKRRHSEYGSTPIAAMPEHHLCGILGRVAPVGELLTAPFTGRPCVYYSIEVLKESNLPTRVVEEQRGVPFTLSDLTGDATIDPSNAEVAPEFDYCHRSGWHDRPTDRIEAVLARHRTSILGVGGTRRLLFRESVIAPGDMLSVVGAAVRELDNSPRHETTYRSSPTRLRIAGSLEAPLSILQKPRRRAP